MVDLYNPNAGLHGRKGGPFLDEVQNRQEEEIAAIREGREPDFDNAPWRGAAVPVQDIVKGLGAEWTGEQPTVAPVATYVPEAEEVAEDAEVGDFNIE